MASDEYSRFNDYLNSVPLGELRQKNEADHDQTERDFQDLCSALKQGRCSLCKMPMTHFAEKRPCLHWLMAPRGFKKKHLPLLYPTAGFHRMNGYLRWVANSERPLRNINDLAGERSDSKVIEETIRYKNREWSFSCSLSDRAGHQGRAMGSNPHFHLQMKIDGRVVIAFSDLHIPFDQDDELWFAIKEGRVDRVKSGFGAGRDAGMQALFSEVPAEELIDQMEAAEDEESAAFDMSTVIIAKPGTTISGSDIAAMFAERERSGQPIAKLARTLKNAQVQTIIAPGKSVPEIAVRTPRQRGRGKSEDG